MEEPLHHHSKISRVCWSSLSCGLAVHFMIDPRGKWKSGLCRIKCMRNRLPMRIKGNGGRVANFTCIGGFTLCLFGQESIEHYYCPAGHGPLQCVLESWVSMAQIVLTFSTQ